MSNIKNILKSGRVIILLLILLFALVTIHPNPFATGAAIRSIEKNGPAYFAGIANPKPTATPMSRERVISINNVPVTDVSSYYSILNSLQPNVSAQIRTNKGAYIVTPQLNNLTHSPDVGINVYDAPTTNLRKGLELQGGTRVLLQPETDVSEDTMQNIIASMGQRLNVYGISDVTLVPTKDLSGNKFVSVEIAGATEEEVKNLLANQGKFEAKVGNKTVFVGGKDITYVCKTAECSGIDPNQGCGQAQGGWVCRFRFSIALTPSAAQRQADTTKTLEIITKQNEQYLNETLDLFLDNQKVDQLNIGADLKGRAVTDIAISGSGQGASSADATNDALQNMKRLQTILITGSLPVKMNIVKTDTISPLLGQEFSKSIVVMTLVTLLAVIAVIFIKYREIRITLPISITLISEIIILLGVAALIGWNLDLAAIAGIIVAVGTGVDDQIVITDETLRGEAGRILNWKERFKRAFFVIMAAYFTVVVSMIPLYFAGAGILKGFAITTIIGISVGVFITRPAYAAIVEQIIKEKQEV